MSVEHILLSSDADESSSKGLSRARVEHARLDQYSPLRRFEAHFVLFNHHYIAVDTVGLGRNRCAFYLDLGFIDPQPKRARVISWSGVIGCMLFASLASVSGIHGSAAGVVAAGACAIVCAVLTVYLSYDRLVFYSRHGRVPLVVLFNRNPDAGRFTRFIDELVRLIKAAHSDWPESARLLSAELREHRRLLEQGVLSAKRYEIVKTRILQQHH